MRTLVITNCGTIASGLLDSPVVPGDTIVVRDGVITEVGEAGGLAVPADATVVDAGGHDILPGLIDTHIHPVLGDWTPRTGATGWLEHYVHAGVTTAVSQGSFYLDNYPDDAAGMVHLGATLARAFRGFRPGGMKVHGACISLVDGLTERDFALAAHEGVWLIAEIGVHSIADPTMVRDMLDVAHPLGFTSRVHFGPQSILGSHAVTAEMALRMGAHIAAHINGGPTGPAVAELDTMIEASDYLLELNATGNRPAMIHVAGRIKERGELSRLMIGSDTPTGAGTPNRAIIRTASLLVNFAGLTALESIAVCTGNAAAAYGLATGRIAAGAPADLLAIDAPRGSQADDGLGALAAGDIPSIGLVVVDGHIQTFQTRNTLPGKRACTLLR